MVFTERERDMLEGLGSCLTNKEIATRFDLSEGTIKVYVSRLMGKTKCGSRLELALRYRAGLLATASANDLLPTHLAGDGWRESAD